MIQPLYSSIALVFVFIATAVKAQTDRQSHIKWEKEIIKGRKALNVFYRSDQSPLKPEHKLSFRQHDYFDPDSQFRVTAVLERMEHTKLIDMPTTTSRLPKYRIYGLAHFVIKGHSCTLELYEPLERSKGVAPYLFLPFKDETSGEVTYGGGRYLDLSIPKGDTFQIDFNRSYYPYCAYNEKYSCPLVPAANVLDIPIEAGIRGIPAH